MSLAKPVLLVLLLISTVWVILRTKSAIDFREKDLESPAANQIVEFQGVRVSRGDFLLHYVVEPRANSFAAALIRQDSTTLWTLLYALYGMIGNYLYYLMRFLRSERPRTPGIPAVARFAVRLILAALCGIVCFLLIKPIASPLGGFFGWVPKSDNGNEGLTVHSVSDTFLFLPVLAGAFIGTFYEKLEGLLSAVMERLSKWLAGKK